MEKNQFSLQEKVAVVTGGAGVLGGSIARSLIAAGVKVAILDIRAELVEQRVDELTKAGGEAIGLVGSVLDMDELERVAAELEARWGGVDILINAAGGNLPGATLTEEQTIFDMKIADFNRVTDLNMNGTVYPSITFGKLMAKRGA